jgi:hypothetical protein
MAIKTIRQLTELAAAADTELAMKVFVDGRNVVLLGGGYEYRVAADRCDTAVKLLEWVAHLAEKTWMDMRQLRRFIDLAAKLNGINIHVNA